MSAPEVTACPQCAGSGLVLIDAFGDVEPWPRYVAQVRALHEEHGWPNPPAADARSVGMLHAQPCPRGCQLSVVGCQLEDEDAHAVSAGSESPLQPTTDNRQLTTSRRLPGMPAGSRYVNFATCAALHCEAKMDRRYLMCLRHWRMVPSAVQALVWRHFRPGQLDDLEPSRAWYEAAAAAVEAVARAEGREEDDDEPNRFREMADRLRRKEAADAATT